MMAGAVLLTLLSARYFALDPEAYFPRQRDVYEDHTAGLLLHIGGMIVPALLGPAQFLPGLRDSRPRVHAWMGRAYLAGAVAGALAGLYMSQFAASGAPAGVGFALLAVAVLGTAAMAFREVRRRNISAHRDWMTRNYALIFAAVTLRIYLTPLEAALGEDAGYAVVAWACWLPNLVFAEWLIRSRRSGPAA